MIIVVLKHRADISCKEEDGDANQQAQVPVDRTWTLVVQEEVIVDTANFVPYPRENNISCCIKQHKYNMPNHEWQLVCDEFEGHVCHVSIVHHERQELEEDCWGNIVTFATGNQYKSYNHTD